MSNLDWQHWFEHWETMLNCYVPQRPYRFDLMLRLADLPREDQVQILDLGCGPGSLGFRALRRYPNAHVVAVDSDPVLLSMGQAIGQETASRIQYVQADIQQPDWWAPYDETFDLVLSATALHSPSVENLKELYGRIYQVLKPGGWFMNSGHMASGDPNIQVCFQEMLHVNQQSAFHTTGAYDWSGFWQNLGQELKLPNLLAQRSEGFPSSDGSLPKQSHITDLRSHGFEQIEFHWQNLGEAVVSVRKILA